MGNNEILIRFGGDGNIKVDTLTNFLEIYKEIFFLINNQLGHSSDDLIIEVSPPEEGSFKIKISAKYKKAILVGLGSILTGTISGLIVYYVTTDTAEKSSQNIKIVLERNDIRDPEIHKNVYNVFQNTGAEQKIHQTFIIANNDQNITDFQLNQSNKQLVNLRKSEIAKIANQKDVEISASEETTTSDVLRDEANLVIKTLHFEGNAKWAFIFRGYPIKALIKDIKFSENLGNQAFRKGDTLKVILSRKRYFDEELQTYIVDQNSYVIDEVIKHISRKDNQKKIDFN